MYQQRRNSITSNLALCLVLLILLPAQTKAQVDSKRYFRIAPQANRNLLQSQENLNADIILTSVPRTLFLEGDARKTRIVTWEPDVSCLLRYSRVPGNRDPANYTQVFRARGAGSLPVNVVDEDLTAGIYHCILVSEADPTQTSVEFRIIVQANVTPTTISPLGSVNLQQGAPLFRWDPVSGVPYYFLFLSEGPISIDRDEEGSIVGLSGLNLIWQVITPQTFLRYGEPDPAGNFSNEHIPPLIPGVAYNWIVLNSYGPNPDFISADVAPSAPFFFEITRPTLSEKPILSEPADGSTVSSDEVEFKWSPVAGATRYRVFLYEETEFQDNLIKYALWSQITGETTLRFPAKNLLVKTAYAWRVIAENENQISDSGFWGFSYSGDAGRVRFEANSPEGLLSRVSIDVANQVDGSVLLPAVTDTIGIAELPLPVGNYSFVARRSGFEKAGPFNFTINNAETTEVPFEIRRAESTISGRVVDESGNGILNATVEASAAETDISYTDGNGYFVLALAPGSWNIRAYKLDFQSSDYQNIPLGAGEAVDVGEIQIARATNIVSGQAVFADDNRAFQSATVTASNGDIAYKKLTNGQGGFQFSLPSGSWKISIDGQGFFAAPAEYNFELTDDLQVQASFQLFSGALVYGVVTFEGLALDGVTVQAVEESQQTIIQSVQTNQQGHYTFGLPAGNYEVLAVKENFLISRRQLSVEAGETYIEDFSLSEAGIVSGRVRNLETALPVEGASVFVIEDTTIQTLTNFNGEYSLSLPPGQPLQIDVSLPGFTSLSPITVTAQAGEVLTGQDFFLEALSGIVRGRVTDGFAPVIDAKVAIPDLSLELLTDENGRFEFEIPPGEYELELSKECHFRKIERINLVAGTTLDLELQLLPLSSSITGEVRDASGRPLPDTEISAISDTIFTTMSNAGGNYELCLGSGIFRVRASKVGYFSADTFIVVNEADLHAGVNFVLEESFGSLTGIVQDTSGAPVARALVRLKNEAQDIIVNTTDQGSYQFPRVVPGNSSVQAIFGGFYGKKNDITLGPLDNQRRDLVLYPADGSITGGAFDSNDSLAIADVRISAQFEFDPELVITAQTDELGQYRLDQIPVVANQNYRVFAFKEGFFLPAPAVNVLPKTSDVNFYLVRKNEQITGLVQDFDTGEAIAGARIEGINSAGGRSIAFSDTAGRFELLNLVPSEIYNISAQKAGYFAGGLTNIAAGDTAAVIEMFRKYGFVQGRIISLETGAALANIPVKATVLGLEGRNAEAMTNSTGSFLLRLAPDFYKVEPNLTHFRSEPAFEQIEVTELDTIGIDGFAIEAQTVQRIVIQRADQTEQPAISNQREHCYIANALDSENRPVNIGSPGWSLNVSNTAAIIDAQGCVTISQTYFGELSLEATDRMTNTSGQLDIQVFAQVDSTSQVTLFDDRGLQLEIPRTAVLSRRELLVSKIPVTPAKKGRAELFISNESFELKPSGLAFNAAARLSLPFPPNTEGQERFIALWDSRQSQWRLLATVVQSGQLQANIIETGEYVSLALSAELAIENLRLTPNPFSPFRETDNRPGMLITFDLSSNAAPTPLVSIKIYNLEGNLVRLLHDQTPFPRGPISINWNGKTDDGTLARNGRYLVRVIAEDPIDKRDEMKSVVLIK